MAKAPEKQEEKNLPAVKEEAGLPMGIEFTTDDVHAGFEETDASSYAIPFLRILQAISPQAKKSNAAYIDGAEEGDFFNTVNERLYKGEQGVIVIPVHYKHVYNEWQPNRGGFRGQHTAGSYALLNKAIRKDDKGNDFEANAETGNQLVDTREHYVMIIEEDGGLTPALIALTSSELKKSKKWMTFMRELKISGKPVPMQSQMYRITPTPESNDKGDWMGHKIEHIGSVQMIEQYQSAKEFYEMVRSGKAAPAQPIDVDGEGPF